MTTLHPADGPRFLPLSVELIVEQLSQGLAVRLTSLEVELVLKKLVDQRECPMCGAGPGFACYVFGGFSTLMRTHVPRLHLTRLEKSAVIRWARRTAAASGTSARE